MNETDSHKKDKDIAHNHKAGDHECFEKYKDKPFIYLLLGLLSLGWFLIRTGTRPSRIVYPCQQTALANSLAFVPGLTVIAYKKDWLIKKLKKYWLLPWLIIFALVTIVIVLNNELAKERSWGQMTPNQPIGTPAGVSPGRVVWTHDDTVTTGSFAQYWSQIDQAKTDAMMEMSLKALAGTQDAASAVAKLFPCGANCAGKKIAIKINMNNVSNTNSLDANHQVVNALVKYLTSAGGGTFNQADITVFDVARTTRSTFTNGVKAVYPQVNIMNQGNAVYSGENYTFDPLCKPTGPIPVLQLMKDADYIINMPLVKQHDDKGNGATLAFKNTYGMHNRPGSLHSCLTNTLNAGTPSSPDGLASVYTASFTDKDGSRTSIDKKTKLIIGDGIYADYKNNGNAFGAWSMFGNKTPSSLFVSQDPVAVDTVMYDVIMTQRGDFNSAGQKHLETAAQWPAGSLGVHEHPGLAEGCTDSKNLQCWKYTKLDYVICDISGNKLNPLCVGSGTQNPTPTTVVPTFVCAGGANCAPSVTPTPVITSSYVNPTINNTAPSTAPTTNVPATAVPTASQQTNNPTGTNTGVNPTQQQAGQQQGKQGKVDQKGFIALLLQILQMILELLKSLLKF